MKDFNLKEWKKEAKNYSKAAEKDFFDMLSLSTEEFARNSLHENVQIWLKKMFFLAMNAEIEDFIEQNENLRDKNGQRRIVRNGYHKERDFITGIGKIPIVVPRAKDRLGEIQYQSSIIPRYLRRTKEIDEFIPWLYLKGISTLDFSETLSKLLNQPVTLSPGTVLKLKEKWEKEYKDWENRDLSNTEFVYLWADGVYFNVRLEDDRCCILVIVGVTSTGKKKLLAAQAGFRESEMSWREILLKLKKQGLQIPPKLAIADGALGFRNAMAKEFPSTRHQLCWVHKTANVLDKMPKSIRERAKKQLWDIYLAESKENAYKSFDFFVNLYKDRYPAAVRCLEKHKEETLTFYDFPKEHWIHIRSTNPIESTFATVRLRTYKTKGCGSAITTLTMVFKLMQCAEKRWHRLHGYKIIPLVLEDKKFVNGELENVA